MIVLCLSILDHSCVARLHKVGKVYAPVASQDYVLCLLKRSHIAQERHQTNKVATKSGDGNYGSVENTKLTGNSVANRYFPEAFVVLSRNRQEVKSYNGFLQLSASFYRNDAQDLRGKYVSVGLYWRSQNAQ